MRASTRARDFAFGARHPGASCYGILSGCFLWIIAAFAAAFIVRNLLR